jgi:hypothetical protein
MVNAVKSPILEYLLVVKIKRKSPTPRESFQSLARQSKGSKRLILSTRSRPPFAHCNNTRDFHNALEPLLHECRSG